MPNTSRPVRRPRSRRRSCPCLNRPGLQNEVRAVSTEWLAQLVVLVKERAKTLVEMVHWVRPYFGEAVTFDEEAAKKFLTASHRADPDQIVDSIRGIPSLLKTAMGRGLQAAG